MKHLLVGAALLAREVMGQERPLVAKVGPEEDFRRDIWEAHMKHHEHGEHPHHHHHHHMKEFFRDRMLPNLNLYGMKPEPVELPEDDKAPKEDDGCKKCTMGGVVWIVKQIIAKTDEVCGKMDVTPGFTPEEEVEVHTHEAWMGKGKCNKKEMWCKFWKKDKEVALGFVTVMVRPWSLAHSYCIGHGECKKELDMWNMHGMKAVGDMHIPYDAAILPDDIMDLSGDHAEDAFAVRAEASVEQEVQEDERRKLHELPWHHEHHDGDRDGPRDKDHHGKGGHHGHVCPHCYKKVFGMVMRRSIGGTKMMCEKTKCPFLQNWCKWAGKHPKMAYGMILGKVEPWKYALGRCWHPDGKHGHHWGHHGHHGKPWFWQRWFGHGHHHGDHHGPPPNEHEPPHPEEWEHHGHHPPGPPPPPHDERPHPPHEAPEGPPPEHDDEHLGIFSKITYFFHAHPPPQDQKEEVQFV